MKKTTIILAIFLVLFILVRPDKMVRALFQYQDFLKTDIPKNYEVNNNERKSFIYANEYKNFYPILFFRNNSCDYILFKLTFNINTLKVTNMPFHSVLNTISSSYEFTNGDLNFYLNEAKKESSKISINGIEIKEINFEGNIIFETNNDFEIFQNENRIFYYQAKSASKKFIVVKKGLISQVYIIETVNLSKDDVINRFLN